MAQIHAARYITMLLVAAAILHGTNYIYYSIYVPEKPSALAYVVDRNTDGESKFFKRVKQIASSLPIEDQFTEEPIKYYNKPEERPNFYEKYHQSSTLSDGEIMIDELQTTTTATKNATSAARTGVPVLDLSYFKTKVYWLEWCPMNPPNLGPIADMTKIGSTDVVPLLFTEIQEGGKYKPKECMARQRVAVIVPYPFLDHYVRLATFLYSIHPLLVKQMLDYRVFVVEQVNETILSMSPGMLMNIGYKVAQRERPDGWDCFIFHVPELIALDSRNLYTCDPRGPRQLVTWIQPHRIADESLEIPNKTTLITIGGVMAMTPDQFKAVNGFSNILWQRGDEYEDMKRRIRAAKLRLHRSYPDIAKYGEIDSSLPLRKPFDIPETKNLTEAPNYLQEGFSSLSYAELSVEKTFLYTMVSVDEATNVPREKRNDNTEDSGLKSNEAAQSTQFTSKKVFMD